MLKIQFESTQLVLFIIKYYFIIFFLLFNKTKLKINICICLQR